MNYQKKSKYPGCIRAIRIFKEMCMTVNTFIIIISCANLTFFMQIKTCFIFVQLLILGEIMTYKDDSNPCAATQQESVLPELLLSYHDEIMRSRCGKKDKLKGQTPSLDCEEQAYLLHVHPEAADANHVRCFHDNQHLKSCYLGNRWQAKGYTAGRVNHEASSFKFHITPKSWPLKSINISYCISMTAVSPVGHSLDDNTAYINHCF